MLRRTLPGFCALLLLGVVWCVDLTVARGAQVPNWSQVRPGMTAEAVVQAVGEPLFKTSGKVYQTWIYDRAGEILFANDVVVAVTPPKIAPDAKGITARVQAFAIPPVPIG